MPDDGNGSWWQKMWAIGAGTSAPRADPVFDKESAAELSRRLGERAARQATIDPAVAARERRAALDAWDRARVHRQKVMAGGAAGVLAVAVLAWLVVSNLWLPEAPSVSAAASAEPAPRIASAAAAPVSPAPEPAAPRLPPSSPEQTRPSPTASLPVTPVATPAASPAPPATVPAPPETASRSTPSPAPALGVDEVREVQTRLLGLGFNPGPIDGATGRMTTAAAMRYQQERSLEQTGKVDRSLLEQLRQDPNPQIAQPAPPPAAPRANSRAGRPDGRTSRTTAQRDPGPFDRMGRWLDSLTR